MASRKHGRKDRAVPTVRRDAMMPATRDNASVGPNASSTMKPDVSQKPESEARSGGRGGRFLAILPIVGIVIGLAIMLYYPVSEGIDAWRRGQIAETLDTQVSEMDDTTKDTLLEQAEAYNKHLAGITASIPAKEIKPYEEQLTQDGRDVAFGYITIPSIALTMPIYHGTSDAVLSAGVGHVENTSLPIGGSDTHSVLSAHSGMEGMRAFDDIRELEEGSVFGVKVLGRLVCYRVYDIETVLPDDTSSFAIQAGRDLCTLVTCTPYGVNDHRLLVHGERCPVPVDFEEQHPTVAQVVTNRRVMPATIAVAAVAAIGIGLGIVKAVRKGRRRKAESSKADVSSKDVDERGTAKPATAPTGSADSRPALVPHASTVSIASSSTNVGTSTTSPGAGGNGNDDQSQRRHHVMSTASHAPIVADTAPSDAAVNQPQASTHRSATSRRRIVIPRADASAATGNASTGSTPQEGENPAGGRIVIITDNRRDR